MAAAESSSVLVSEEALTYTLCLSSENRAYSEGYIFFVLWERCFVWLPTGFGKSIFFQTLLQAAYSAGINKKEKMT